MLNKNPLFGMLNLNRGREPRHHTSSTCKCVDCGLRVVLTFPGANEPPAPEEDDSGIEVELQPRTRQQWKDVLRYSLGWHDALDTGSWRCAECTLEHGP